MHIHNYTCTIIKLFFFFREVDANLEARLDPDEITLN